MSHIAKSATDLIGNTPLLELGRYCATHAPDATILAKLEFLDPAGSAKDRIAKSMIEAAEAEGKLGRARPSSNRLPATPASDWPPSPPPAATASSSPCRKP